MTYDEVAKLIGPYSPEGLLDYVDHLRDMLGQARIDAGAFMNLAAKCDEARTDFGPSIMESAEWKKLDRFAVRG